MSSGYQRPPTPGFARVPRARRILMLGGLVVLLAAGGGGYLLLTQLALRFGTPTDSTEGTDAGIDDIDGEIDQKDWLVIQRRQFLRTGLLELDQQGERIWENIDQLQKEIDAYQCEFSELQASEESKRLINDEWAVRYFVDKWGEALAHDKVAKHCQMQLNELMFTVKRVLAKTKPDTKRAAYEISPETQKKVDEIEWKVNDAKEQYTLHRGALRGLARKAAAGEAVTPETFQEAIDAMRSEIALKRLGYPSANRRQGTDAPDHNRSEGNESDEAKQESRADDPSSLLHDVQRNRSGVGEDFTDTTLGRDAVRDRNEPPRPRR